MGKRTEFMSGLHNIRNSFAFMLSAEYNWQTFLQKFTIFRDSVRGLKGVNEDTLRLLICRLIAYLDLSGSNNYRPTY